jgi:hypothetical protein
MINLMRMEMSYEVASNFCISNNIELAILKSQTELNDLSSGLVGIIRAEYLSGATRFWVIN